MAKNKTQNNVGKVYRGKTKYIDKDTKPERKKLFSWWWNYEVKSKNTKYPL